MFFLLRMAFWIALVLLLLPLGLKGTTGQDVSVFDAFGAAQAVVADVRGFCTRQPDACAVGGQMVTHLTEKAQAGAKWLSDTLSSHGSSGATATGAPQNLTPQDLTPQDLAPAWGSGEKVQPASAPQPVPAPAKRQG
ncbi:DUF5330 domain-containing protein [Xanthobacter agilis]|uniref:DUF5330 domain-containing protein n=1 Tax=Xanthobacter agilis TaxID=47492 RepID=A0ABU0LDP0_XANAG|nr:DUF5330 domain-containing protein [Xanthobacter agilis]MDQ0505217.1 hypothetical protein [Xanthobacter agilis]